MKCNGNAHQNSDKVWANKFQGSFHIMTSEIEKTKFQLVHHVHHVHLFTMALKALSTLAKTSLTGASRPSFFNSLFASSLT